MLLVDQSKINTKHPIRMGPKIRKCYVYYFELNNVTILQCEKSFDGSGKFIYDMRFLNEIPNIADNAIFYYLYAYTWELRKEAFNQYHACFARYAVIKISFKKSRRNLHQTNERFTGCRIVSSNEYELTLIRNLEYFFFVTIDNNLLF